MLRKSGAVFFLVILGISCSRNSCPLSSGNTKSENRVLPVFREIDLYDKINLILTPDAIQNVRVETGSNMLSGISTNVTGETLMIQDNNGCKLLRTEAANANIYISTSQVQKINYFGAGDISSTDTIRIPVFTIDCFNSSGSIDLKIIADSVNAIIRTRNSSISLNGAGSYAYVYNAEEGSVNLSRYRARTVYLVSKSLRDIDVNVTDSLHANVLYMGNVYYQGNPSFIQSLISSSGKLIHTP